MDPELIKLVKQAVLEGITSASWIFLLVGLLAAGVGAFLGTYVKTKGKNLATKEDFDQLLRQTEAQTKATEGIKREFQEDLNAFTDKLERGREIAGFRRERIGRHLDEVLNAYIDMYAVAQLIPIRKWLHSNSDLETEARFRSAQSRLRAHFGALYSLGVVSSDDSIDFERNDFEVLSSWNRVLGEAAVRTPEYRSANPSSPQFSATQYHEYWMKFMTHVEDLGKTIKQLSRAISLPQ